MNYGDGLYGGQFVGAMYAEAFFENDPEKIVRAGLAAIPEGEPVPRVHLRRPGLARENPDDWQATWKQDRREVPEEPRLPPVLVQQEREGAVQVQHRRQAQRRLHRDGTALRRGRPRQDHRHLHPLRPGLRLQPVQRGRACCSRPSATRKLPEQVHQGPRHPTKKFNSTPYTFPKLVAVCDHLADQAVRQAGGRIDKSAEGDETFVIPVQQPQPSAVASCWKPGPRRAAGSPGGDEADHCKVRQ